MESVIRESADARQVIVSCANPKCGVDFTREKHEIHTKLRTGQRKFFCGRACYLAEQRLGNNPFRTTRFVKRIIVAE